MEYSNTRKSQFFNYILKVVRGNTIIIAYTTVNGTRYIWYINDNYVFVISFVVSTFLGYLIKFLIKVRKQKIKTKNIITTRGGSELNSCIEHDKVYEIIDEDLKKIIRDFIYDSSLKDFLKKMFISNRPLVVSPFVMFLASTNRSDVGTQLALFGVEVLINNLKAVIVKGGGGVVLTATTMYFIKSIIVRAFLGFSSAAVVISFILMLKWEVPCSQLVHELPKLSVPVERNLSPSNKAQYLLDVPQHKLKDIILLKDFEYSDNFEIYAVDKVREEMCSVQIERSNQLNQKCENVQKLYIKLDHVRISSGDIKRRDSSEMRKKASDIQENYEWQRDKPGNLRKPEDNSETSPSAVENVVKLNDKPSSAAASSPLFRTEREGRYNYVPLSKRTGTLTKLKENDSWKKTLEDANIYSHIPTYKTESSKKIKEPTSNQDSEEL